MPRKGGQKVPVKVSPNEFGVESEICSVCNLPHSTEECPLLNSGLRVDDTALPSKAVLTLPDALEVKQEDGKWHVLAKSRILHGVQFGPLDAPRTTKFNTKCSYPLKVFAPAGSSKQFYFLDTSDEDKCNWMVLVPFSNDAAIRNCICYQLREQIYFTVVKDIEPGDPLIVGYSPGYLAKFSAEVDSGQVLDSENAEGRGKIPNGKISRAKPCEDDSGDHDYTGVKVKVENPSTPVTARRSTRKRKVVEDDVFIFETIPCKKKEAADVASANELDSFNHFIMGESGDENSVGFYSTDDGDFGSSESRDCYSSRKKTTGSSPIKNKDKFRTKGLRLGAVLAYEEWTCKFCDRIDLSIPEFASHLIEHYKSVGAARTEKSRLQKVTPDDDGSQTQLSFQTKQEPNESEDSREYALPEELASLEQGDGSQEGQSSQLQKVPKYPYYCDICVNKKVFNRAEYLIRHLRNHTGEISCTSCAQMFTKESYLEHDCPQEDSTGLTYSCSECNNIFTAEKKLHLHLEWVHSKAFECSTCQKSFTKNDTYESHKCNRIKLVDKFANLNDCLDEVSVLRKCDLCDSTFLKVKDLEKHLKTHGDNFTCTTCDKELTGRNFRTHTEICDVVSSYASGKVQALKCPKCLKDFESRDLFRYHVATHTHPAMCPVCNLRLPSTTFIRAHNCSRFQCDGCQEEFVTLFSLKKHISAIHGPIEFYCFECALPFVTQNGYASHQGCGNRESVVVRKKTIRKPKEEGMFVCEVCGATYTKWSSLKTHRYTHGPKRFVCDLCGKSFHRREMLADHEYVHQEAQFECAVCQKKMKSKKSLDVHMQIHKGNKRFKCDQCDKAFCQKINLTTHKLVHLPPDMKGFECPHCGKKFASKEYLGFHIEGHVKGRNEICEICGRSFVKLHMLNQHKKTAHGNQSYACEFCSIVVRQKHSLTRHLKKRHMEMEEQWSVKGYLESRFVPGDGSYSHLTSDKRRTKSEQSEDIIAYNSSETDECVDNSMTLNRVDLLTEVVDVDTTCEVETEEITFSGENMIIPDSSNMMILQVEEGGEIVLTLASADSLPCTGATVVEGMIVDDVSSLQLQCSAP